uniref:hypothetical protein n=1 Tax=Eubacterium cellulosolvens TaxID=29322 RepID=UPI000488099A|nr:hypothetical protein [[Eubacterium] cellulosolvens]
MNTRPMARITVLTLLFFAGCLSLESTPVEAEEGTDAKNSVTMYRNRLGLPSLSRDPELDELARIRACEIAVQMSHTRPNGEAWYSEQGSVK